MGIAFATGIVGLGVITSTAAGEAGEWFDSSWGFAKQILPLLLMGVLVAGLLLGRPGEEGLIPSEWVAAAVGGNSLPSNILASVADAFMYFATLTEVPIVQGLLGASMGKGPALALLLAGPALGLPNMLVIRSIRGGKKTAVSVEPEARRGWPLAKQDALIPPCSPPNGRRETRHVAGLQTPAAARFSGSCGSVRWRETRRTGTRPQPNSRAHTDTSAALSNRDQLSPLTFRVDYPDKSLNRLTTFFRFLWIIPILIIATLLTSGTIGIEGGDNTWSWGTVGVLFLQDRRWLDRGHYLCFRPRKGTRTGVRRLYASYASCAPHVVSAFFSRSGTPLTRVMSR